MFPKHYSLYSYLLAVVFWRLGLQFPSWYVREPNSCCFRDVCVVLAATLVERLIPAASVLRSRGNPPMHSWHKLCQSQALPARGRSANQAKQQSDGSRSMAQPTLSGTAEWICNRLHKGPRYQVLKVLNLVKSACKIQKRHAKQVACGSMTVL